MFATRAILAAIRTPETGSDATDAELLRRFIEDREEAAFEAFVRRHARLFWEKLPEAGPLIVTGAEGLPAEKEHIPPNGRRNLPDAIARAVRYFSETGDTAAAVAWRAKRVTFPPDAPGRIPPAVP